MNFKNPDGIHDAFSDLRKFLNDPSKNYTLKSANRVFGEQTFKFQETYQSGLSKYFGSELEKMNFRSKSEEARQHINGWVSSNTEEKIKELFLPGSVDASTILTLANAVYFKALWKTQFDLKKTKNMAFRLDDGSTVQTPMMHSKGYYGMGYSADLASRVLRIPYQGNASMLIILPQSGESVKSVGQRLTLDRLNRAITSLGKSRWEEPDIYIPKFKFEKLRLNLGSLLGTMGMKDLFSFRADLSGIGGKPGTLRVSSAVHEAFVKVDETGTEAAAATGIVVKTLALLPPLEFRADRPFLFLIRENVSGSILFMGRVMDPS